MSYVLKPTKMKFKDPISGNYVNINAVSSDTAKSVIEGWLRSNPGELVVTPLKAATAAAMTNTAAIYIYTGSQTGYTYGNWYYHDGTTWVSGGPYSPVEIDANLTNTGAAADAKKTGDEIADLKSAINGSQIPWEIGGVNTAGLSYDTTRMRMGITIKTVTPIKVTSTYYFVLYVYDLQGSYISNESAIVWSKTDLTIKPDRLFRIALRKDDNSNISSSDMATMSSGVIFSFSGQGSVLFLASRDGDGNQYPTVIDAVHNVSKQRSFPFAKSLIDLLKSTAFVSNSGQSLLSDLADSLSEILFVVYNFEPRMIYDRNPLQGYISSNKQRMTTQKRYFPIEDGYVYTIRVSRNTESKVWVGLQFLNETSMQAIDAGNEYGVLDYYEPELQEVTNEKITFTPSTLTINNKKAKAVRICFAFGDEHNNDVSLIGTELLNFRIEREVNIDE